MKSHGVSISSLTAVVLCCAAVGVEGLYQEDAGRWDWQKSNFRNVRDVCVTGKKVYVAAEGVVGAVAGKSGNLVWRRKVPGDVLYVRKTGGLVIAVTGDSVHAFSDEGALMWEQGLPSPSTNTPIGISGETGEEWPCVLTINPTTATLTALPIQIDGASLKFGSPVAAPLPGTLPYAQIASIKVTDGSVHILTVTSVLHELQLASSQWMLAKELPEKSSDWAFGPGDAATITAYSKTLQKCFEKNMADTRPAASGCLLAGGALDTSAHSASMGSVADVWSSMQGTGQRTVVKFETGDLALFQNGELTWTRDDGLALVESVKAYDIPDEESDDQVHTPIEEYMHILHHQWSEVQRMLSDAPRIVNGVMDYVVHRKLPQPVEQDNARDIGFGLQKTLVMASPKAVFSVSSLNGSLAWKVAASSLLTADEVRINKVFITLATATQHSHPHLYVWATGVTGGVEKDYMMELSAANGEKISMKEISAGIEVVFETANYFRNGYTTLLVVKKDATAEVYPAEHVRSENFDDGAMRYHTFTKSGGSAAGYHITHDMKVVKTWSTNLLSAPEEVVVTSSLETYNPKAFISTDVIHVHGNHSTGKNEVLSKYVNKNAFLVVTAVPAGILKEDEQDTEQATGLKRDGYLVLYLIDGITGSIVASMVQPNAVGHVALVSLEHMYLYTFFNTKRKRYQLGVWSLFKDTDQHRGMTSESTTSLKYITQAAVGLPEKVSYSSFEEASPQVIPAAFTFPLPVKQLAVTVSEKGVANKQVIATLSTDEIVTIDVQKHIAANQQQGNSLISWIPTSHLNYNTTVFDATRLATFSTKLESTCLVMAFGSDIFFTRTTSGKPFDLLPEDFEYTLLLLISFFIVIATVLCLVMSKKQGLKAQWA